MQPGIGHNNGPAIDEVKSEQKKTPRQLFRDFIIYGLTDKMEKLVAHTLEYFMDKDGNCHPSISTLMHASGIKKKDTLLKILKQIEEKKIIWRKNREDKNKRKISNQYGVIAKHLENELRKVLVVPRKGTSPIRSGPPKRDYASPTGRDYPSPTKRDKSKENTPIEHSNEHYSAGARNEISDFLRTDPYTNSIQYRDDKIYLLNGTRQKWLEEFGGSDRRLDLALTEIVGYIQPNSSRPIRAQVESKLAEKVGKKIDQDERYDAAVKRNQQQKQQTKPANNFAWLNSSEIIE